MAHTDKSLEYFSAKWDVDGAEEGIQEVREKVIRDGHIDINMLMDNSDENGVSMALWIDHFSLAPGLLLQLRCHAVKWRKTYGGLKADVFEKIAAARRSQQSRREQNRRSLFSPSAQVQY